MKILVVGAAGQLGTALQYRLATHDIVPYERAKLDITNFDDVTSTVEQIRPEAIINAAAYNFVDKAETDSAAAFLVNETGPENLAKAAKTLDIPLVHVSTDYVFDGTKQSPYVEVDVANPLSVYGKSKLAGEKAVIRAHSKHFVVRTSWVYNDTGRNFFRLMYALSIKGPVKVVADQFSLPTYAPHLAEALGKLLETENYGIHHFAGSGEGVSRYELLKLFYQYIDFKTNVAPTSMSEFSQAAARPKYTVLASSKSPKIELPHWKKGLEQFAREFNKRGRV